MTNGRRQGWRNRQRLARQSLPAIVAAVLALAAGAASGAKGATHVAEAAGGGATSGGGGGVLVQSGRGAESFGFEAVQQLARDLAAHPFDDGAIHLEHWLEQFDYDDYREIEFRREASLWYGTGRPFQVQFFHRGGIFPNPVQIHVIRDGQAEPLPFSTDLFNYRALEIEGQVPAGLGFAGLKVLHPVNDPDRYDEVMSFLGSSYFRVLGKGSVYGLSARGLAVDASRFGHEEFPWFRAFWIEEGGQGKDTMRLYALLDSQSVSGAYQFDLTPGDPTVVDVEVVLFTRRAIEDLGVAPLTSMYLFGESGPTPPVPDFRPEVHDSDGLLIHTVAGEYIWRPLRNPDETEMSAFAMEGSSGVRGFGLLQRDRDFEHYQDLEAVYQNRPSAWIDPTHGFGHGEVRLIELASDSEAIDSIVAYWAPRPPQGIAAGEEIRLGYRMLWGNGLRGCPTGGKVIATRKAAGEDGATRYVIDFEGAVLAALPPDAPVKGNVMAQGGLVGPVVVQHNPFNGTWRLFFDVTPESTTTSQRQPVKVRAFLEHGEDVVSETWSYRCSRIR